MALDVEMLTVGAIAENCFLVRPQGGERMLIVDPGEEMQLDMRIEVRPVVPRG